ncbi:thiamine ABC transporter substrate-binding protein [Nocardioides iriomotensis]|uniref:Thiamine ABC transporter substrate-binding protein n=1 Tax=Nocardioides iriomotensis TaxID=715784 RepID=A0A4Q5J7I1_9ACTN|nr:thiamine ABC transporter substrate-binding protein [Nocardioides iriomotensis]RYU14534.1 thiamine ABC transporter substrate-binding protein [Nocardioides iriomotensis]
MRTTTKNRWPATAVAATAGLVLAGCSLGTGDQDDAAGGSAEGGSSKEVVVATHDSWNMSKQVLRDFEQQTGYDLTIQPAGDAGALTNKLVLTKGSPIADAVYGIDNTFASRAVDEGVLTDFTPKTNPGSAYEPQDAEAAAQLTPVDYSDVCVNVDDVWFKEHDLAPPTSFEDLADPAYDGLFVTPAPSTSSPGLAFLAATVAEYGEDGWQDYWQRLVDNDVKVTAGWSDAYQVDFTAGGGSGDRPIVLSYASSPPFTIPEGETKPTTSALLDTCFRQVEYAAVLDGAANPEGAQAFVDFLGSRELQEALPDEMYVFPVDPEATLPDLWAKYAVPADDPATLPESEIAAHRSQWLEEWADIAQ